MRDRTFVNHTVRITVVKVACYTDLGEKYAQYRPGADRGGPGHRGTLQFFQRGHDFHGPAGPLRQLQARGLL